MALFDSIINETNKKFNIAGDKVENLLSALLTMMTDKKTGGFAGFMDRFEQVGLGDTATSWVISGDNAEISSEQLESAVGENNLAYISDQTNVEQEKATSALAFMTPKVVDSLTPEGEIPDDKSLLATIGGYLTGLGGGATAGTVAAMTDGEAVTTADTRTSKIDVAEDTVGGAVGTVGDAAEVVGEKMSGAFATAGNAIDVTDDQGESILKWLLPLIVLSILLAIGFNTCRYEGTNVVHDNSNQEHKTEDTDDHDKSGEHSDETKEAASSFKIVAQDGKYIVSGFVKDEATKEQIIEKLNAELGEGNVNFDGLKVVANSADFGTNWWENFGKLLPSLKGWKTGSLAFVGNRITEAEGLSDATKTQLKSFYGEGWTLPASISGNAEVADRTLTEVTLSDDTKLQAYPGGIEDQLIKFIQSAEYKNATDEDLSNKWFDFDDLNFKFGTTELVPESKRQLDNIVAILKQYPEIKMKIGGYTDKKGDDAANKKLSDERAKAVKAALEKANVGTQVPEAEGYGEEFAKVPESASDEERLSDRRTSIRLIK